MNLSMIITNYTVFNEVQLLYGDFLSSLQVSNQPLQYLYENNEMDEDEEEEEEDKEDEEDEEEVEEVTEQRNDFSTSTTIQNSAFDQTMDLYIPNNYCPSFIVK